MFRVAVLVKQVPRFDELSLGAHGRLQREGIELELNPFCRRAVSKGLELARQQKGRCTAVTLGPPSAEECLREAIAWGADEGVHVTDPAFAGSDTLATARALAATITRVGPFDLVLVGRNSVDSDTGQVGPQLAELLGLPFLSAVRSLVLTDGMIRARCERDDGWMSATTTLPALISCAERLCDPAKADPKSRALVAPERIRRITAADLGPGPWGSAGSPTAVGEVRTLAVNRRREILEGPVEEQVRRLVRILADSGALDPGRPSAVGSVPASSGGRQRVLAVLIERDRRRIARELLGSAARLAKVVNAAVVAVLPVASGEADHEGDLVALGSWGADEVLFLEGSLVEEDVARSVTEWSKEQSTWVILAPGTAWGREIAARVSASLGAGLTGDAVELEIVDGRLLAWKAAFGGSSVVAITASSAVQMVTVHPGVLPLLGERAPCQPRVTRRASQILSRVRHLELVRDDDMEDLAIADTVVGIGTGIAPEEYPSIEPLLETLGAQLAGTRKVTDEGWLPRSRQIGITGRAISPDLYIAIALSGKFNHMVGVSTARVVVAINSDASAPVFGFADLGIISDWREVVPLLVKELCSYRERSTVTFLEVDAITQARS